METFGPMCARKRAMSESAAPAGPNPVEVLIKSAPPSVIAGLDDDFDDTLFRRGFHGADLFCDISGIAVFQRADGDDHVDL